MKIAEILGILSEIIASALGINRMERETVFRTAL